MYRLREQVLWNLRCHTPSLPSHQVQGVLDLYPVALAHPCGMPCIFKQVLHFEISSRCDIWLLNISGSWIPQPSECKYRLHQTAFTVSSLSTQLSTCLHLSPSTNSPPLRGTPGEMLRLRMPHTSLLGWSQADVVMLWLISTTKDRSFKGARACEHDWIFFNFLQPGNQTGDISLQTG